MSRFEDDIILTCKCCGVPFAVRPHQWRLKFCSRSCGFTYRNKRPLVKCATCGDIFRGRPADIANGYGQYCSTGCWSASRGGRQLECEYCGSKFYASGSTIREGRRFCSKKCKDRGALVDDAILNCMYCGLPYAVKPHQIHYTNRLGELVVRQFCSTSCSSLARKVMRQCPVCGDMFHPSNRNNVHCSPRCYGASKMVDVNCPQCGVVTKKSRSALEAGSVSKFCSRACSTKARRKFHICTCASCGRKFDVRSKCFAKKYCSNECMKIGLSGRNSSNFLRTAGRELDFYGYVRLTVSCLDERDRVLALAMGNRKVILEHRLIMARHLGRPLKPDEQVHHTELAKDKADNRIEVLRLTDASGHTLRHWKNESAGRKATRLRYENDKLRRENEDLKAALEKERAGQLALVS